MMPICKLNEFMESLTASQQRLMGVDLGTKNIGLALSDRNRKIASPLQILTRKKFSADAEHIIKLIGAHDIGGMVLGWPLNMDGSEGAKCDATRDFAHAFLRMHTIPIYLQDERLSTRAVEAAMIEADLTRKQRGTRRDALAASWILQNMLDHMALGIK